ncbi:MAG: hypothetical protein WC748_01045 [Legionellales bacterium]|jgi:hypothetical protein
MKTLKTLFRFALRAFARLFILCILWPKSCWLKIQSLFKKDNRIIDKEYAGQKILLIALYQKGTIRQDLKNLLTTAKRLGFYTIGVNTLSLQDPGAEYFDCYIERFNFGRDFGSYKAGFNFIFEKKYNLQCPRLLMCNDSVFYERTRTEKFLRDLMNSTTEVLGATENYHGNYHLGSFCIAMSGRILCQDKFIDFWKSYKNSEMRPCVIRNGEIQLSACLKRLVIGPENLSALYDIARVTHLINTDDQFIKAAFSQARRSGRIPWKRLIFNKEQCKEIALNYLGMSEQEAWQAAEKTEKFFQEAATSENNHLILGIKQFLCAKILRAFREESQIHQNNAFLLYLGMPLIKLDGFFRGVFSEEDVLIIAKLMQEDENAEIQKLLFSKSYGKDVLQGINYILYSQGFL